MLLVTKHFFVWPTDMTKCSMACFVKWACHPYNTGCFLNKCMFLKHWRGCCTSFQALLCFLAAFSNFRIFLICLGTLGIEFHNSPRCDFFSLLRFLSISTCSKASQIKLLKHRCGRGGVAERQLQTQRRRGKTPGKTSWLFTCVFQERSQWTCHNWIVICTVEGDMGEVLFCFVFSERKVKP